MSPQQYIGNQADGSLGHNFIDILTLSFNLVNIFDLYYD
jgi:hypothetical protein